MFSRSMDNKNKDICSHFLLDFLFLWFAHMLAHSAVYLTIWTYRRYIEKYELNFPRRQKREPQLRWYKFQCWIFERNCLYFLFVWGRSYGHFVILEKLRSSTRTMTLWPYPEGNSNKNNLSSIPHASLIWQEYLGP